jgi:cation diffusion facilitator CzcD-associated flavoprotein CzcO
LNKWEWPKIPGLVDKFKGTKVHSAKYDPSTDLTSREVALIGGGSTGIQILPAIQPLVKRVDHYMKGQQWISPVGMGGDELVRRKITTGNCWSPLLLYSLLENLISTAIADETVQSSTARRNWTNLKT